MCTAAAASASVAAAMISADNPIWTHR